MPAGLEDVSKYPDLFDRLADSRPGEPTWSSEDLQKLAGLNLIRVLEEVEKVSYFHSTRFPSYSRTRVINCYHFLAYLLSD
jgi:membrane dipeptidase